MPPHGDSMDGPVVTAARRALETGDVDLVLPFVPADAEGEVRAVFGAVRPVRGLGPDAAGVADRLFFETVVRLHRAGEGAPFTGLKPAGLSVGPVIPLAERAVETESPDKVADFLGGILREELTRRLGRVTELAPLRRRSVEDGRRYVEATLGFEVFSHHVLTAMRAADHHRHGPAHEHPA
ncbi:MAG TPA: DUF6448 family protein [Actinotalea sp.]|nr:DUF6448 family protein [Actinotalea sp.]